MPVPDLPPLNDNSDLNGVKDYLILLRRRLNDFLNHLDTLNVDELDAGVVNAGTLNAALVTIKAALTGAAFIQLSSAGMVINDGTKNTFTADVNGLVTMVGALIQSATGYPRVEINSTNKLLAAYQSATQFVQLLADIGGQPELYLQNGSAVNGSLGTTPSAISLSTPAGKGDISISSGQALNLFSQGAINLSPTTVLTIGGVNGYSGSFSVVTGVDFVGQTVTTKTITVTKGIVTNVV